MLDEADINDAKELFEQEFPDVKFLWRDKGHYTMTNCPFHNDHTPSMGVYIGKDGEFRFNCFSCGKKGKGIVGLLKEARDIPYKAAYKNAVEEGLLEPDEAYERELQTAEVLQKFYKWTNSKIRESERMMLYLANRGVNLKIIEELPIGLYPGNKDVLEWAEKESVPSEIIRSHLVSDLSRDARKNKGALIFFYRDFDTCELSFMKIRKVLTETAAKQKGKVVDKQILYLGISQEGTDIARERKSFGYFGTMSDNDYIREELPMIFAVEGEFDALVAISRSYEYEDYDLTTDNIIAVGSCNNFNKAAEVMAEYRIYPYIFPDNDKAGLDAVKRLAVRNPYTRIVLPEDIGEGEDPADYMNHHNYESLIEAAKGARTSSIFLAEYYGRLYDNTDSAEIKQQCLYDVSDYGLNNLRPIEFDDYANAFASITGYDRGLLKQDMEDSLMRKSKEECEYFISNKSYEYGTHKWVYTKNGKVDTLISKVILSDLHSIYEDNCEGYIEESSVKIGFHAEIRDRRLKKADIVLESSEFVDNKKLNSAIVDALGAQSATPAKYIDDLREALKQLSADTGIDKTVRSCIGWSRDLKEYYFYNAMVDKDGLHDFKDVKVLGSMMPKFMSKYSVRLDVDTDENFEEAKEALLNDFLKVYPYSISLPAFVFVMSSVVHAFVSFVNPSTCILLGHTNSFKTAWTKTLISLFGDFTAGNLISWSSTALSIVECGWYPKDAIFAVDDCKPEYVNSKSWVSIIQNAGDSTGRTKLSKDSEVRNARAIRGAFLNTGEDLPSIASESAASRTFVLQIEGQGDREHLTVAQEFCDRQILPVILVRFIKYLIDNPIDRVKAAKTIRMYRDEFASRMARTNETCAYLKFVWELLCNILPLNALQSEFDNALKAIELRMTRLTKTFTAGVLFKDTLRELIADGSAKIIDECYLSSQGLSSEDEYELSHQNMHIVGWSKGEYAYILPSMALKVVQDRLRSSLNMSLEISPNKLYDELKRNDFIVPGEENLIHARPIWNKSLNPRVLRFRKNVLIYRLPPAMPFVSDDVTDFVGYE